MLRSARLAGRTDTSAGFLKPLAGDSRGPAPPVTGGSLGDTVLVAASPVISIPAAGDALRWVGRFAVLGEVGCGAMGASASAAGREGAVRSGRADR